MNENRMATLTAFVLSAFVGYLLAAYVGWVDVNFALMLLIATVITGAYWVAERWIFWPARQKAVMEAEQNIQRRLEALKAQGIDQVDQKPLDEATRQHMLAQPWWLDWTAGLFPVVITVFLLRSFVCEPFKIPSGSMMPTLLSGDFILVNKFHYGLRLPVLNTKVWENHSPQRGDVVVFRYPPQPSVDYIKRVIGLPGDEVAYINKRLTINGQPVDKAPLADFFDADPQRMRYIKQFEEKHPNDGPQHRILNMEDRPAGVPGVTEFTHRDQCRYTVEGVTCKVPDGHYFVMGDNRDDSMDSRFWGFVPDANLVGKAFFIWMNFSNIKRIGRF